MRTLLKRGFTLVELLVVVAIIALLIAILLPMLGKARRSAERVQCLANIAQLSNANLAFSVDNDGRTVPGGDTNGLNSGIFSTWLKGNAWKNTIPENFERFEYYRRGGALIYEQYSNEPDMLYCPSFSNNGTWLKPRGINPNNHRVSGWFFENERPAAIKNMMWSYHYRETYAGREYEAGVPVNTSPAKLNETIDLETDPTDMVMFTDWFTGPNMLKNHHKEGYNFSRADGGAEFYRDDQNEIGNLNGGATFNTKEILAEVGFESMRHGYLVEQSDLVTPR